MHRQTATRSPLKQDGGVGLNRLDITTRKFIRRTAQLRASSVKRRSELPRSLKMTVIYTLHSTIFETDMSTQPFTKGFPTERPGSHLHDDGNLLIYRGNNLKAIQFQEHFQ